MVAISRCRGLDDPNPPQIACPININITDMLYNELKIMKASDPVAGASSGCLAAM
jgi:hypothetical protein